MGLLKKIYIILDHTKNQLAKNKNTENDVQKPKTLLRLRRKR